MEEEIVSQRNGLGDRLFVVKLPFEDDRCVHDDLRDCYLCLPSRTR
jgi:hypothetical protein